MRPPTLLVVFKGHSVKTPVLRKCKDSEENEPPVTTAGKNSLQSTRKVFFEARNTPRASKVLKTQLLLTRKQTHEQMRGFCDV